ncbi:unnamed protein product [Oikopleura dioica]|uniref:Uncharacterized protein n=1 Tax=Oikopleura dioica TaxID=34765 RepID=E4XNI8_OIKDI|nr:unnamed protein product [Oikopleura dioica]
MKKIICVFATSPGQLSHVDSGGEARGCGVCLHFTERMFDLMGNHLCQECYGFSIQILKINYCRSYSVASIFSKISQ